MKIIAKAGDWRVRDGNSPAYRLEEQFHPDIYDLTEETEKQIKDIIGDDEDLYIEVYEDGYWIAI